MLVMGEVFFPLVIIEKVGTLIEFVTLHVLLAQKTILMRNGCSVVINFSLVDVRFYHSPKSNLIINLNTGDVLPFFDPLFLHGGNFN